MPGHEGRERQNDRHRFEFTSTIWRHHGDAAWYFITLPHGVADDIDELTAPTRRGFGSVRVEATIGASTWHTSLFPDSKVSSYVLPVKRSIREAEGLDDGDAVGVRVELVPT